MEIIIDYLEYSEQVRISNECTNKVDWKTIYTFICDYLPPTLVSYSSDNITFPWRYFLSVKGFLGQYFLSHKDQYKVVFSDNAKKMMQTANDKSYNSALSLTPRTGDEIKQRLS